MLLGAFRIIRVFVRPGLRGRLFTDFGQLRAAAPKESSL